MNTFSLRDFSAGWCPSDSKLNGRANALLKMDSVELDENGVLSLTSGTVNWRSTNYPSSAHTLFSKFLNGTRTQWLAFEDGTVYRNANSVIAGGAISRAAFYAAFNYVFIFSGTQRKRDNGTLISSLGVTQPNAPTSASSGAVDAGNITGDIEYAQQAVYNTGSGYLAKSPLSSASTILTLDAQNATVTPSGISSPANEYWIFRRGGTLDDWYRIAIVYDATPFVDSMTDTDALTLNERTNIYIANVDVTGIENDILEVVGPVNGRSIMFTASNIYFSLINSPDSYDVRTTIGFGSAQNTGAEQLLWARKVGENSILVGTTQDVYLLTGTFIQLPDGYLDVYLRPLGVKNPPISPTATVHNNSVIYMGAYGWRVLSGDGTSESLISTSTDLLYKGYTRYGYGGVPSYVYPNVDADGEIVKFRCVVAKNKLWCVVPYIVNDSLSNGFEYRLEIYDFLRKYWRTMPNAPTALTVEDDDAVTGFFEDAAGNNLRQIDCPAINGASKTLNGENQEIDILTLFQDAQLRYNRKDTFTIKLIIYTGGSDVTFNVYKNGVDTVVFSYTVNTSSLEEIVFDVNASLGFCKTWQFGFTGAPLDFALAEIEVSYEARPKQVSYLKLPLTNFGVAGRKKIPQLAFSIDTLGNTVEIIPIVDGINQDVLSVANFERQTKLYQFSPEALGTDLSVIIKAIAPEATVPETQVGVLYEDSFARADGALGSTWLDKKASGVATQLSIVNSKLRFKGDSATAQVAAYSADDITDQFSEIKFDSKYTGQPAAPFTYAGLAVRMQGMSSDFPFQLGYAVHLDFPNSQYALGRYTQSGSSLSFAEFYASGVLPALVQDDMLRLSMIGNILSFSINGIEIASYDVTGGTVYSTGKMGLWLKTTGSHAGDYVQISKWRGGSLPEISPETPEDSDSFPVFEFYEMLPSKFVEALPDPLTYFKLSATNFGSPNKKRLRVWPILLDTLGEDVTFTPYVDGVSQESVIFNSDDVETHFYFFTTDVFGVDYAFTLEGDTAFEFYKALSPDVVQVLPIARRYDQIGPSEMFRYAKIRKMTFNMIAFGGTQIPYSVRLNDVENQHGYLNVSDGKDGMVELDFGKTVAGNILRVILGPTDFNFHRIGTNILVAKQGLDSDMRWEQLDGQVE